MNETIRDRFKRLCRWGIRALLITSGGWVALIVNCYLAASGVYPKVLGVVFGMSLITSMIGTAMSGVIYWLITGRNATDDLMGGF